MASGPPPLTRALRHLCATPFTMSMVRARAVVSAIAGSGFANPDMGGGATTCEAGAQLRLRKIWP